MASEYWKKVGARLASHGKDAVNAVIEVKLHEHYLKTIRNSAITLALNAAGVLILIFQPFGKTVANWLSQAFFFSSFVFWLIRTILYCKNYGKMTVDISKNVILSRSLSKGISRFIVNEHHFVALIYTGIDIASNLFSALKKIPRLNELVKIFIQNFWKRLALFAGIMTFYSVIVYWVIKPIIIRQYF